MNREQFIKMMADSKLYDLTQGCSIFTPPWPGDKALKSISSSASPALTAADQAPTANC